MNKYLAAYGEFTVNLAKLKDLTDNFNAGTEENKQGYKKFAQDVYNAYKALSEHDMIALDDEDLEAQKEYDDNEYGYVPEDVTSDNIAYVVDGPEDYISTYGQFNAFFSQNTKELGSIYLEVAGTGTAVSPENLTAQLRNPNLENAGEQWWGTDWTAFGNSTAEQSGKPFITYQQVHLPLGYYTLVGYGMDRRGSWADVLAKDEGWNKNHRTYLFSHLGDDSDSTMVDAFKAKNMALTADITNGAGNISTCEVDGVTYYTPNSMAQYRAWENAKIAMAGQGHAAVVQFEVWQDEGDFGSLGFAHRWHADNTWFVADGIQLYYAKDDFPKINIDTPDCASVTITNDGWATFYTDKALAFSGIKGLTAYTAKRDGSTVTLTPVDNVPANTGVVLKGDAKTYNIPIIASSTTDKGELQGSATTATAFDAHAAVGGIYVLGLNDKNEAQFEKTTSGNVPAGKPYLLVPTAEEPSSPLRVVIAGETTVADKSALNTAITEAEAYYNSIKDSNPDAAAALQTAINTAKTMQEKGDATQEEVNSALSALTTAKTTAEQTVLTETKTALNTAITAAETYYNSIKDSNPTAAATLLEAINAAKAAKDNTDATQEQVDAAIAALAGAKTTAEQTVLTETKTALNTAITEAEAYYNSIKDSNPEAAATLLAAINAAKTVKDNTDATQEQVDAAIAALAGAKTTAEQTVLTNKFDIQFNAANANTIEAGKATVTVGGTAATVTEGKLEGVKMGSEVKIEAKPGYKFRKVEVKKAASGPEVTTFSELQAALSAGKDVKLMNDIVCTEEINITSGALTIDGNGKQLSTTSEIRAFKVGSSATVAFKNLIITGFVSGGGPAINNSGTIVLDECTIGDCHVNNTNGGGAIENKGKLYAIKTAFIGNHSGEIGGAINNYTGSLYMSLCTFIDNYTTKGDAYWGGAIGINMGSEVRLINCYFSENKYYGTTNGPSDIGVYNKPTNYTIAGCTGATIASRNGDITTIASGTATLDYSDLSNITFTVEQAAKPAATVTTAPTGAAIVGVGKSTALVSGGVADGGTMMYAVTTTNTKPASTDGFSGTVPTAQTITASGTVYVWYYVKGDDTHTDSEIAATAIEVPVADIVWDATNVSDLDIYDTDEYEMDDVKLSGNAEMVEATWNNSSNPEEVGISFRVQDFGGFTFTAPSGKAFTKIEMNAVYSVGWKNANPGTGWTYFEDVTNNIYKVTWTGSAASSVELLKDANEFSGAATISYIVFYLVDAE